MSENSGSPPFTECFLGLAEGFLLKIKYYDEILPKALFLAALLIRQVQTYRIVALEDWAAQGSLFPNFNIRHMITYCLEFRSVMSTFLLIRVVFEDFFEAFHLYFDVSFTPPSFPIRRSAARIISGILKLDPRRLRKGHYPPLGLASIEKGLSLEAEFSLL